MNLLNFEVYFLIDGCILGHTCTNEGTNQTLKLDFQKQRGLLCPLLSNYCSNISSRCNYSYLMCYMREQMKSAVNFFIFSSRLKLTILFCLVLYQTGSKRSVTWKKFSGWGLGQPSYVHPTKLITLLDFELAH